MTYDSTGGTATIATTDTWDLYTDSTTTTATIRDMGDGTYVCWNQPFETVQWIDATTVEDAEPRRIVTVEMTPEQVEAMREETRLRRERHEQQIRELNERHEQALAARLAAEGRAKILLEQNLEPVERRRLHEHNHFIVRASSGCRYRIRYGRAGNVDRINLQGMTTHRLCAHPAPNVPDYDTMLAQKLMLETDEPAFLAVANASELSTFDQELAAPPL